MIIIQFKIYYVGKMPLNNISVALSIFNLSKYIAVVRGARSEKSERKKADPKVAVAFRTHRTPSSSPSSSRYS